MSVHGEVLDEARSLVHRLAQRDQQNEHDTILLKASLPERAPAPQQPLPKPASKPGKPEASQMVFVALSTRRALEIAAESFQTTRKLPSRVTPA